MEPSTHTESTHLDHLYGFSTPTAGFSNEYFGALVSGYVSSLISLLIDDEKCNQLQSKSLCEALRQQVVEGFNPCKPPRLDPVLGDARAALSGLTKESFSDLAARIALSLSITGALKSSWRYVFDRPEPKRFGNFVLPPCHGIEVDMLGDSDVVLTVHPSNGVKPFTIIIASGVAPAVLEVSRWVDPLRELPTLTGHSGLPITILFGRTVPVLSAGGVYENVLQDVPTETIATLQSSIALLDQVVPDYGMWVARVLQYVYLLRPFNGIVESGSTDSYLGLAHLSAYDNPVAVGEILIHESAHQYFNLVTLARKFDDGSDEQEYYSPAVNRLRPLNRVAVAYHAFANVTLYYRQILEHGADIEQWCERHIEKWDADLRQLELPLRESTALTPTGRALCEPLISALKFQQLAGQS